MNRLGKLTAAAMAASICLAFLLSADQAQAARQESMIGLPAIGAPGCQRCVDYRYHHSWKEICCSCKCECLPPVESVVMVYDPCTCCKVPVRVCLPPCCTDCPSEHCRKGLFGRSITNFEYCCGFRIKVVMNRKGDVTVHYYGKV